MNADGQIATQLSTVVSLSCGRRPAAKEIDVIRSATFEPDAGPSRGVIYGLAEIVHDHGTHALVYEFVRRGADTWSLGRVSYSFPAAGLLPPVVHPGVGLIVAATRSPTVVHVEASIGSAIHRAESTDGVLLLFVPIAPVPTSEPTVRIRVLRHDGRLAAEGPYWLGASPPPHPVEGLPIDAGISIELTS
jgi:hypothetical protein